MRFIALLLTSLSIVDSAFARSPQANPLGELEIYKRTLIEANIEGNCRGATDFLAGLLPDSISTIEIEALVQQLGSSKYNAREQAEAQLIAKGPASIGLLRDASENGNAETLSRIRRCIRIIAEKNPETTFAAIQVLRLDKSADGNTKTKIQLLLKLLPQLTDENLSPATRTIQELATPESRHDIEMGLNSPNESVRFACIRAIPECMPSNELHRFRALLDDESDQVALTAVISLGKYFPNEAMRRLVHDLLNSNNQKTRADAASIIRTVSGEFHGFAAYDPPEKRNMASSKWKDWFAAHKPFDESDFTKLELVQSLEPQGFLVSVSGMTVNEYDLNGDLRWQQKIPLYDARHCVGNLVLVSERDLNRVTLIDRLGNRLRQIEDVSSPSDAELLPDGNILVLHGSGIATEHDPGGLKVREVTGLSNPFDIDRLPSGNTIVADSGNHRLVEFDAAGNIVWEKTNLAFPNNVFRVQDGRTLYTTYTSGIVVMLDSHGKEQWQKRFAGGTLYSVYAASDRIYVSDGSNQKIWILDMNGKDIKSIDIPVRFCDVGFITR